MDNLMSRRFSCRNIATALLAAGCTTGTPAPTRAPDPTVAATETGATTATAAPERPTPTAIAPASTPTDAPASTELRKPLKVVGPATTGDGKSELLAVLASLPVEFQEGASGFPIPNSPWRQPEP